LEKAGYTAFTYLKGVSEEPWLDPGLVGELFAQSQHRLVIDTKNSRGSEGVSFEKWCCSVFLMPERAPTRWITMIKGASR
jgi:hypothetical protein